MITIAILGAGQMGTGLARTLIGGGADVITSLEGRSEQSRDRARQAGMRDVAPSALGDAAIVLSIVPPTAAESALRGWLADIEPGRQRPVYVDCNAVSPAAKKAFEDLAREQDCLFVDGTIVGLPPGGAKDPTLFVAGEHAPAIEILSSLGIDLRIVNAPVGTAAAIKLCHAGIAKGLTALMTSIFDAAAHAGVTEEVRLVLWDRLPGLMQRGSTAVPAMYPKAHRWSGEMEEIAAFLGQTDAAAAATFDAFGETYRKCQLQWETDGVPSHVSRLLAEP